MDALTVASPPAVEPVTLSDAKLNLKVDGTEEDALIGGLITAAREYAERVTGRKLITQTIEYRLPYFPATIELPVRPVQSVARIRYTDTEGVLQTLDASSYQLYGAVTPPKITPVYGAVWPTVRTHQPDSVVVDITVGYGDDGAAVPEVICQAIKLMVNHWFENREAVIVGNVKAEELPMGAQHLLNLHRTYY